MTKKKIEQLIDEKVRAYARYNAGGSTVANLLAVLAGAKLNQAQMQEIREQLDSVKWRLVALEDELRRQPKVRIYFAPAAAEQIPRIEAKEMQFHRRVVKSAMRKAAK